MASRPQVISKFDYDQLNDNIYVQVNITNSAAGAAPTPLVVSQTLPSDIVSNPSRYYLSVTRWTLDGGASLPIMVFPDGELFVTLGYNGAYATEVLVFPGYDGPQPPGFPANSLYSYESFVQSVNTALTAAFAALKVLKPAMPGVAPYMFYNPDTYKFDLLFDANYLESVALANRIQFFMGYPLFRLFNNYQALFQSTPPFANADYLLRVYSQDGLNQPPLANIPAGLTRMTQEFASPGRLSIYNGVEKIQIKSSTLNVRYEYVLDVDMTQTAKSGGSSIPTSNLLTDYVIAGALSVSDPASYRQQLVYLPTAALKLTDVLQGQSNSIDLQVVWSDPQGNVYPYMLMPGSTASLSLAYLHRSLYKNFSETVGVPVSPATLQLGSGSRR
jgi:hypothetical protein